MSKCLNSTLILRSARSARLEGWPQAASVPPPFETPPLAAPQGEVSWLWRWPLLAVLVLFTFAGTAFAAERKLDIGRVATPQEIAGWDIDVRPDGQGLPPGSGSVKAGEAVYMGKCAACHGEFGESAGRWPQVAGGAGSLKSDDPVKTVGSYFAHLSTVFDYVRHAMPFGDAQSLSNDELYAVVAYILNLNGIIADNDTMDEQTLRKVKMPNRDGFVTFSRGK